MKTNKNEKMIECCGGIPMIKPETTELVFILDRSGSMSGFEADTVGGWIAEELDCIPKEGQGFDLEDIHVDVVRMDKRRVQTIRVIQTEKEKE